MTLDPGGIIAWLVVGLVAGRLAGMVMKGSFGVVGNILSGSSARLSVDSFLPGSPEAGPPASGAASPWRSSVRWS